jgi:hypothetical protein
MRISTGLLIIAAAGAAATSAMAQPAASDSQFLQASRCAGLAASANLGGDAAGIDGWLKANSEGRPAYVIERADQIRATAKIKANRAAGLEKDHLAAELGGACATYKG